MLDACFYRVTEFKLQKKAEHKARGHVTTVLPENCDSGLLTGGETGFPPSFHLASVFQILVLRVHFVLFLSLKDKHYMYISEINFSYNM